jgi:Leucine-rich repeat (LRR) protein/tRNA A-37 threonylcarbamoyl transferase component Bud32
MDESARRVEAIFSEALGQSGREGRAAYVAAACGGDVRLRGRVEALLQAHDAAEGFLEEGAGLGAGASDLATVDGEAGGAAGFGARSAPAREEAVAEKPGSMIGRYKLLQQIGEGGFGVVYMAEQEWPVKRRVAVKVIKAGMDTRAVIARFEAERQALAMMDHPNIARVLDAGATAAGRPYFVMELVKGIPVTEYCDQAGLDMRQRLELFVDVCRAVQHAHQKGVIHRDLKPSNVMITLHDAEPVVKVIDFGIAKATDQKLTEMTLFTNYGQMIGTPAYMSPEQAVMSGLDVDTRSDIYSLGVLLYELLTGAPPFDAQALRRAGFDEMRRIIREQQPQKPSTRLSTMADDVKLTVAGRRQATPHSLGKQLLGDLDWIVLKAIEKDRTRRYDTANGLAADLRRHLDHEPVLARPPSAAYRFQKAFQRNRLVFAAGGAIAAALVIGIAISVWQTVRARHEAMRASAAEQKANVALEQLRATAPAFAEQARALAAREQFDEAIEKLDYAIKLRPDAADYLLAKGDLLQCQLKLAPAARIYRDALAVKPAFARAKESAELCEQLLAAPSTSAGKLTRESLAKLHLAMQAQQRPAAEMIIVARLLGEDKKLLLDYWLARFKELPVSPERPIDLRLIVRDDGRLSLDLSKTRVTDLSPLAGAPLAALNLSHCRELVDLSPLRGLGLVQLDVSGTGVADLSPLREMHTLETLAMNACKVTELSALRDLRLKSLSFAECAVSDLSPIHNMALEAMNLSGTRVADLSPLIGMPIKMIDLSMAPVLDFSPLARLPLEKCYLQRNRIADLSVLRGKPLKELVLWGCTDARHYAALAEMTTLELLLLPSEYRELPPEDYAAIGALRALPRLRQIGSEIMDRMDYSATGSKEIFWRDWDREQTFVPALRKGRISFSLRKLTTGSYSLTIHDGSLRDLSCLQGAPIGSLDITDCGVSDLTPIHDLPLETLSYYSRQPIDLAPLRGMRLKTLYLGCPNVTDLSPLAGLPLKVLDARYCGDVSDVAPLARIETLEELTLPPLSRNISVLRKLPRLRRLAFEGTDSGIPRTTVEEFWKENDANPWLARLRDAGLRAGISKIAGGGDGWAVDLSGQRFDDLRLLQGASIRNLNINNTAVSDLTPLRGMALESLQLDNTGVRDLAPLEGMPLKELSLIRTKVSDLSPLRGLPLKSLNVSRTAVSDLEPLRGMPLTSLAVYSTRVSDLAPIQGMALESLALQNTEIRNIAPLRGMPLKSLRLHDCARLTDLSPLGGAKDLVDLTLPLYVTDVEMLHGLPNLQLIGFRENPNNDWRPDMAAADFWKHYEQTEWARALRESGANPQVKQLDDGTWEVIIHNKQFSDLTLLKGAPVGKLVIMDTSVRDLAPLRGMPLKKLYMIRTLVSDLKPLAGMRLEELQLDEGVTDLTPLRGMPIRHLRMNRATKVTDFTPLAEMRTLQSISLPLKSKGWEFLRDFPRLERIGYDYDSKVDGPSTTAAQFWNDYDRVKNKAAGQANPP